MAVLTPVHKLQLDPGSRITIPNLIWQEFEAIIADLGEKRRIRLAYHNSILEIMSPSPEHERAKILISDLVKMILKIQKRSWEALGSTTFKRKILGVGIEPDECFYIENYQAVIGKDRLDLDKDPPPDLAIESDITSPTEIEAYLALQVPELWVYAKGKLTIYLLQNQQYQPSNFSPNFPNLRITELIPNVLQNAKVVGSSQALQEFEDWLISHQ